MECVDGYPQCIAEIDRVKLLYIARYHHHIVCRLVVDHKFSVAVTYHSPRWIEGFAHERVGVGKLLVITVHHLQIEQPHDIYEDNDYNESADYVFTFFEFVVFSHRLNYLLCESILSTPSSSRNVRSVLQSMRNNNLKILKNEKDSIRNIMVQ